MRTPLTTNFPPLTRMTAMLMMGIVAGSFFTYSSLYQVSLSLYFFFSVAMVALASVFVTPSLSFFLIGILLGTGNNDVDIPFVDGLTQFMTSLRTELSTIYQLQGLADDDYGIVAAVTLGQRHLLSPELRVTYAVAGTSHLFALSGLHITIIYILMRKLTSRWLTSFTDRYRETVEVAVMLFHVMVIWAYVVLTGCHASIMRAAVMLTVYAVSRQMSRMPDGISVLTFTCFVLLFISPHWLFDAGFQMSFMAVAGIILVYTPLRHRYLPTHLPERYLHLDRVWMLVRLFVAEPLLLSLCATVSVMPLVAYYFGNISCYFLLSNLFVPVVFTAVIYLAIGILILGIFSSYVAVFSSPASWFTSILISLLHILNGYLSWVSALPGSYIGGIRLTVLQTIFIYISIVCALLAIYHIVHGIRRRMNTLRF